MSEPRADHGDVIELARTGLESSASTSATITDVKHLASYNWIEASSPTIAVPGSPARWSPPRGSRQVRKDSGLIYIAQNAARHPSSPLEPLFRSLFIEQPSFDISSVDVVTDRNNIRKLLSFINPSLGKNGEPFTIQVDMAGQTAIFCRDETATTEVIRPDEFRGYGHEFEKAYTVSQIRGSTGHHRVISYRLGGLNFLVRHETDGYVEDVSLVETDTKSTEDNLVNSLRSLSLSAEGITSAETPASSILTIRREGVVVPRESTLEIKTRVSHKPLALREVAPQLWVSQTPKLIRAYHQRGKFAAPEVEDVTAAVKDWEQSHQEDIKKLVALISRILQLTRDWSGSSTIRYNPINDRLVVERVKRKKALPDDLYTHWSRTHPDSSSSAQV
ncbi:geranylgeranyl pyrophosphate synthetase [Aspergillus ambiguus]|uniref:geranylgeranyl pyrophosphate synthetase n=1 Tax=Aspergillus ambiguus TaxID=176160 RepID=UPI003CCE2EBB